jgi:acyl dehydratase
MINATFAQEQMNEMSGQKIEYKKLTSGYEFRPTIFSLDREEVKAYLEAVEDRSSIYEEEDIVPPIEIAALAMTAMSSGLDLPAGAIHVSQDLEFVKLVRIGERLTSYARVNRKMERGKFHMLTIGISILNQNNAPVLSGETSFILPMATTEAK